MTACLDTPGVAQVLAVTDDAAFAVRLAAAGCAVVPDGVTGDLNGSLRQAVAEARRRWPGLHPVALCADLPALRPDDLARALAALPASAPAFVADAAGTGTTLYAAPYDDFDPHFGPGSRAAHLASGAVEVPGELASLRQDVDDLDDLPRATALGLGARTPGGPAPHSSEGGPPGGDPPSPVELWRDQAFLAVFFAGAFLAGAFLAAVFLAGAFFAGAFLAGAFFAVVVFLAGAFLAAAVVFLAGAFLAGAAFFAGAFLAGAFFAGAFFAGAFLAGALAVVVFLAVVFLAAAVAFLAAGAAAATVSFGSFLAPETTFFRSWPGLNFGTAVFFAFMRAPVCGLRTQRASRTRFSKEPKPVIATFSPLATSRVIVSSTASSACAAAFLFPSKRADSASISCDLFTDFPSL